MERFVFCYALRMITIVIETFCKMSVVSFALAVIYIDSSSESCQDSSFSEIYFLLLLMQYLV